MNITRRRLIQFTAGAAAVSALPAVAADTLTLWGPPVTPTVLLAVAAEIGEARKIVPFKVQTWRTPDQLRAGLLSGEIGMSIVPSYVAANLRNQGQAVILRNIMTRGLLEIMSKDTTITEPAQLKNQPLVMPFKGDMPELVLKILAKRSGVELGNIAYAATAPTAVALFLKKEIPNALLPEPLASVAFLKGKKDHVPVTRGLALAKWWNDSFGTQHGIAQAGLMTSEKTAKEYAEFLAALDKDLQAAVVWVDKNPAKAAEIATAYLPAPAPALQQSFAYSALCAVRTTEIAAEVLQFFNALYALNPQIVGGKEPTAALFG